VVVGGGGKVGHFGGPAGARMPMASDGQDTGQGVAKVNRRDLQINPVSKIEGALVEFGAA
jgi:hypothetical protein